MTERSPSTRLFVDQDLGPDASVTLSQPQTHQLRIVHRLVDGAAVALFNGRDGEWLAEVSFERRQAVARVSHQRRKQSAPADIRLLFAPIKHGRIDFLVEKASELGAGELWPVLTHRTQVTRVNTERLRQNAREAAEQCERLNVPLVREPQTLDAVLRDWDEGQALFVCAEAGRAIPAAEAFSAAHGNPAAILIGPEGGFDQEELDRLIALPFVTAIGLGPRLLRAETAALAALSCWQALAGEWRHQDARPRADCL